MGTVKESCERCDAGEIMTTNVEGATSRDECQCPHNYYKPIESQDSRTRRCEKCDERMVCDGLGTTEATIVAASGYYRPSNADRLEFIECPFGPTACVNDNKTSGIQQV
jgi:hypothetical protein